MDPSLRGAPLRTPSLRILFLVAEDWLFVSFRLALARELIARGDTVAVACRVSDKAEIIQAAGVRVYSVPFARESVSPLAVLRACAGVRGVYRQFRPGLVQAVALRPILVGWLATIGLTRVPFVNLVTGLGSLFCGELPTWRLRVAKRSVEALSRGAFRQKAAWNVFQNGEDHGYFLDHALTRRARSRVIRGSGVDTGAWLPQPEPAEEPPVILYVGRLLRDKGLCELVEASRLLRRRGLPHRLRLVGACDPCNPTSLTETEVRGWEAEGVVEWLGWREDVLRQMSEARLVVLPSYREGFPKVLLEAGVAERAVVTCDTVGCREVVKDGYNGLLVPPRNPEALAEALARLLADPGLRRELSRRHRQVVCDQFSMASVNRQFTELYREVLEPQP